MSTEPARYTLALSGPFFLARSLPAGTFPPYARFSRVLVPTPPLGITWQASPNPRSEVRRWPLASSPRRGHFF